MKESEFKGIILFKKGMPFFTVTGFTLLLSVVIFIRTDRNFFIWLGILNFLFFLWLVYFFRNPVRKGVRGENIIISPADGRVVLIETNIPDPAFNGHVNKVAIFLSLFNVHVNRIPVDGKIINVREERGVFIPAYKNGAGEANFQKTIVIKNRYFPVKVKQIAGIIARRIICSVKENEKVKQGDIYGMILFGSRVEITFPSTIRLTVKKGDRVKAGITVIGEVAK